MYKSIEEQVADFAPEWLKHKLGEGDAERLERIQQYFSDALAERDAIARQEERSRWLSVSCCDCDGTGAKTFHSEYDALKGMYPCHSCDGTGYAHDAPPPADYIKVLTPNDKE